MTQQLIWAAGAAGLGGAFSFREGEAGAPAELDPAAGPAGSRAAETFEQLFELYEQRIFNLIYRLVGDYEDAADLTSDTFVQALRSFDRFRGESSHFTWLYRIAVNLCKNYFRRKQHRARLHAFSLDERSTAEPEAPARELEDESQEPSLLLENRELQRELQQQLAALPENFRLLIVLKDVQGLPYDQIGAIIGCSQKAVKSRLFRARGLLRKRLMPFLKDTGRRS
jgi:RNA polymerase sigma-70 factor (ECF subfamily)